MSTRKVSTKWRATAAVLVHDQDGIAQPGATVYGDWYLKGTLLQSGASAQTGTTGVASLASLTQTASSGDGFVFQVTNIVLPGYSYDSAQNTVSQGSISVP